ncbi:MAG: hypothetical protein KDA61_09540 [Planctomycetales bacterium]|nr:hypothetical protein [Planctomycetales bacterium]
MTKERALTAWAGAGLGVAVAMITLAAPYASGQTVRNYDVNLTSTAPVIDGVVSPGEWDAASAAAGDWRELRKDESDVDTENNRFRMLWDDTNLYILYETDFGTYFDPIDKVNNPNPTISFGEDNLNLYIDPNTNGDPNFTDIPESNVDGYQFAFNQYHDPDGGALISTNADRQGVGFFTEAHVNTPFGDQAFWNDVDKDGTREGGDVDGPALQDIVVAQMNGTSGGVIEMVFPWANFNALEEITINEGTPEEEVVPTGLNHTSAPVDGEQWFFNMARINGDSATSGENFLPIWNWHPDQSFARRPHGTLTFLSGAGTPGDADGDGDVDLDDFVILKQSFGASQ